MKNILIYIIILLINNCLHIDENKWKESYYEKYTYKTIKNFDPIHEIIDVKNMDIPLLNASVFYETNRLRAKRGLPQFKYTSSLEKVAQGQANDMVAFDFFSHTSPVKGKKTLSNRMKLEEINYAICAENILDKYMINFKAHPERMYTYQELAEEMLTLWMKSSSHRANILNRKLLYLGVGNSMYYSKDSIPYIKSSQVFATFK